jgi:hypothetical protein
MAHNVMSVPSFITLTKEYLARLSFIKERFERGQTAFHIVDPKFRAEHQQRLALSPHQCGRSGTDSATSRGTLELMRIYKGESCA